MFDRDYFLKSCNLLNLVLLILAGIMLWRFVPSVMIARGSITPAKAKPITEYPKSLKADEILSLAEFRVVADENLFHPSRKVVADNKNEQPVPAPEIVLHGTLRMDGLTTAYVDDPKNPYSTPGKEKRQRFLKRGDSMGGFVLAEIGPDHIVLMRGDEKWTVFMNERKNRKSTEVSLDPSNSRQWMIPRQRPIHPPPEPLDRLKRPAAVSSPSRNPMR